MAEHPPDLVRAVARRVATMDAVPDLFDGNYEPGWLGDQYLKEARQHLDALAAEGWLVVPAGAEDHHIVEFREQSWTMQHPLACRPNLFTCPVNELAEKTFMAPGPGLGRYRCEIAPSNTGLLLSAMADG